MPALDKTSTAAANQNKQLRHERRNAMFLESYRDSLQKQVSAVHEHHEETTTIDAAILCTPEKIHLATIRPRLIRLEPPPWETEEDEMLAPQPGRIRRMFSRLSLSTTLSGHSNSSPQSINTSASTSPVTPRSWISKQISTPNFLRSKASNASFEVRTSIGTAPTLPPIPQRQDSFTNDIFRALRRR
jgi:hypothetical protein